MKVIIKKSHYIVNVCVVLMLLGSINMIGCSKKNKNSTKESPDAKKIAIVVSAAGKNDNGYNQSAIQGADTVSQKLGYDYKIVEPTKGVSAMLDVLAGEDYNVIFNLEYDFEALINGVGGSEPIAKKYPNTTFVVFNDNPNVNADGSVKHNNVISVLFDVHESSFLAGFLSVHMIENFEVLFDSSDYDFTPHNLGGRSIGFVGGTNSNGILVFSYGFIEGINYAAKEYGVKYEYYAKYDAGFTDSALGNNIAGAFYSRGVNVIFSVAGRVGDGVTAKAKEVRRLSIAVDANKDNQQPGYILTSVLKKTKVPVIEISKSLDKDMKNIQHLQTYSLVSGATGITDLSEIRKYIRNTDEVKNTWDTIMEKLTNVKEKIAADSITITDASSGEKLSTTKISSVIMK